MVSIGTAAQTSALTVTATAPLALHPVGSVTVTLKVWLALSAVVMGFATEVLTNDPATGVMRHADAGYDIAIECAREQGLNLPMIGK